MHRILTPADYRRNPWKNGGGQTTEIAVHPPHAGFDDFIWRVSVADVERDGPFSTFPDTDRTVVLLQGAGMAMHGAGEPLEVSAPYEPVTFAADAALDCRLRNGPVRDFNLMVRRTRARGELFVVRGETGTIGPAHHRLCYAASGACECLLPAHVPIALHQGQALLAGDAHGAATMHVNPLSPDAVALVASIRLVEDRS